MSQINLTTSWTQLDNQITQNSGLIVTRGTSVELITSSIPPTSESKGRILTRSETSNVYYGIPTYIRSTSGTAQILLESWYFNFNSKTFVYVDSTNALRFSLDIDALRLNVNSREFIFPTMSTIVSQASNVSNYFGYKLKANTRSNLFQINDNMVYKTAVIVVDTAGGTYRMYNTNNMNEQISGDAKLNSGNLTLEVRINIGGR